MACPFFIPDERCEAELWAHRARLPLGDGFCGRCCARDDGYRPSHDEVRDLCNIGYAAACPRLPQERDADAIRFIARRADGLVSVQYILERGHAPAGSGQLDYELAQAAWRAPHADARVQAKAQCYLKAYLARHPGAGTTR